MSLKEVRLHCGRWIGDMEATTMQKVIIKSLNKGCINTTMIWEMGICQVLVEEICKSINGNLSLLHWLGGEWFYCWTDAIY